MKSLLKFLSLACCICFLGACNDNSADGKKPDAIMEHTVTITPIHGGAIIFYDIPSDPDILYVLAEYERNGQPFTERSSVYDNFLTLEGFNTITPVTVNLFTVSRNNEVKSDPIRLEFVPLESPISLACKSLNVVDGFGGIYVTYENISNIDMALRLMVVEDGEIMEKNIHFSNLSFVKHPFRGFESVETKFALTFEDKWNNVSDTIFYTGTPLFETEAPKPWIDRRSLIPYDNVTNLAGFPFSGMYDEILDVGGSGRYLTASGSEGSSFTFELPQVMKLSRMIMWPTVNYPYFSAEETVYGQVHILEFEMWGTKEIKSSTLTPDNPYWLHPFSAAQTDQAPPWEGSFSELTPEAIQALPDCFAKDWVYLGRYEVERLDLKGASSEDILQRGREGHQFDIPFDCEPVKYIRFFPLALRNGSPPPNNYWQISELSFFGDNTIEDE